MTQAQPSLRLVLSNSPGCIEVVRAALDGLAAATGLDALAHNDLATVVGEAAKNVVLHAYDGAEGPLEVEVAVRADLIEATVRDRGIGIRPRVGERTGPHNGLGMPIVHLLCRRVAYTNLDGGGTEVRMELSLPGLSPLPSLPALTTARAAPPTGALALALVPGQLAGAVLARLLDALALRAEASARLRADLADLAAAIVAGSEGDEAVELLAAPAGRAFQLALGPLGAGLAAALRAAPPGAFAPVGGEAEPGSVLRLSAAG